MTIHAFNGDYAFLSNFAWVPGGVYGYPTVEHFFQAMKFPKDSAHRSNIKAMSRAGDAKKYAWNNMKDQREDWFKINEEVMLTGLRAKFTKGTDLADKLCKTGAHELIEGNYWHDNWWGICSCQNKDGKHPKCTQGGKNLLGKSLMQVRTELQGDYMRSLTTEQAIVAAEVFDDTKLTQAINEAYGENYRNRQTRVVGQVHSIDDPARPGYIYCGAAYMGKIMKNSNNRNIIVFDRDKDNVTTIEARLCYKDA